MKHRLVTLTAALAAVLLSSAAYAGAGSDAKLTKPISSYSIHSSNAAMTENFSVSYDGGGHFECDETRITKMSPKPFVKDSGSCIVTGSRWAPGSYSAPAFGWFSDFEYFIAPGGVLRRAVSGSVEIFDNGDGTQTWDFTFYY